MSNELPASIIPVSQPVAVPVATAIATRFAPNYATELTNLRRWQKSEIAVYVETPAQNPDGRDYAATVREGNDLWQPHLGSVASVRFTQNPAEADVRVSFVNKGALPDGAIGRTEVTYRNRDNVIVSAKVMLDRTMKPALLAQVAAHELGHSFGMEGHSVDKTDLMYARAHLPAAVTLRDVNTLHLNYSFSPSRANAHPQIASGIAASAGAGNSVAAACSLPE